MRNKIENPGSKRLKDFTIRVAKKAPFVTAAVLGLATIGCQPKLNITHPERTPTPSAAAGTPRPPEPSPIIINNIMPQPKETTTPTPAVPESTPKLTPIPAKTPESAATKAESNFTFRHLNNGDVWVAQPGDIVVGDLEADGVPLYDEREETGHLTHLPNGGRITAARNAGDVIHPNPGADANVIIERKKQEMLQNGCVNGCKEVLVQTFPGRAQARIPEAKPTPTPILVAPIRTPEPAPAPAPLFTRIPLNPGQTTVVGKRDVVQGDVAFNGIPQYDNEATTGLVSNVMLEGMTVTAPFGQAAVLRVSPGFDKKPVIDIAVNELDQSGCGNLVTGCALVDVDQVPFGKPQRVLRAPFVSPTPVPFFPPSFSENTTQDFTTTFVGPGTEAFAQPGDLIAGDPATIRNPSTQIDEIVKDGDPATGLIIGVPLGGLARADQNSGFAILHPRLGADVSQIILGKMAEMQQTGCLNGCRRVDVITFPGQRQGQVEIPVFSQGQERDITFGRNESRVVFGGTVISGDINVGNLRTDSDPTTGLVVEILDTEIVEAPHGASGKTSLGNRSLMTQTAIHFALQTLAARPEIRLVTIAAVQNGQIVSLRFVTR